MPISGMRIIYAGWNSQTLGNTEHLPFADFKAIPTETVGVKLLTVTIQGQSREIEKIFCTQT